MQNTLLSLNPKEAGKYNQSDRTIPPLPTIDNFLKIFGRTNSQSVMQSRMPTINYYCKAILLNNGENISRSAHVLNFFKPNLDDRQERRLGKPASLHPMKFPSGGNIWQEHTVLADFTPDADKPQQLTAKAGDVVTVMKNDGSGWSLCSTPKNKVGWLPTEFLAKKLDELELGKLMNPEDIVDTGENNGEVLEQYKAICDYDGSQADGQVAFPEGAIVTVIEKDEDGWWFITYNGLEGWAPYSYLEPLDGDQTAFADELDDEILKATQSESETNYETFYAKRDYVATLEDELSFKKGDTIKISSKSISGWWTGFHEGKIGVVPATYLTDNLSLVSQEAANDTVPNAYKKASDSKFNKPPPRRKTVRHTIMQKRQFHSGLEPIINED
jgi:uncharacterized protein YgiM (DUF1202 family)